MNLQYDTTVHTIDVHLHPFAESLELRDLTTQKTLFKSAATSVDDGIGIAHVETYRSEEGIPVYADHEYAIISTYNNTTGENQDAMASFYMGIRDRVFDAELLDDPEALQRRRVEHMSEVLERTERGVRDDPADPQARYRMGVALVRLERVDEAVVQLEKAVALNPEYDKARRALRIAKRRAGS
jgi:Flp pilus assembly protein TadD